MRFIKQVVLSGKVCGTFTVEYGDAISKGRLYLVGLDKGEYDIIVISGDKTHIATVGERGGELEFQGKGEVDIAVFKGEILMATGGKRSADSMIRAMAREREKKISVKDVSAPPLDDILPQTETTNTVYDDYAIAENNYYPENLTTENLITESGGFKVKELRNAIAEAASVTRGRKATYYERSYAAIKRLFDTHEDVKINTVADGKFVKVAYDDRRFYLVGVVNGCICFGVPGNYAPEPPAPLKDYAKWIPLSDSDPYGRGFWMLFQDGQSGRTLKCND